MTQETERPWWKDRADEIERNVAACKIGAHACYTQMLQLLDADSRAALEAKQVEVKMPEPVAYIQHHKAGDNLEWDCPGNKYSSLYTAHQLRTLLAQHGIKIAD